MMKIGSAKRRARERRRIPVPRQTAIQSAAVVRGKTKALPLITISSRPTAHRSLTRGSMRERKVSVWLAEVR